MHICHLNSSSCCLGYGNIAPKTPWGKVVTILYAIIGIPLLLLCLSNIGDAMAHSFKFIYWKVCCYLCVRPKKRRKRTTNRPVSVPYRQPVVHQHSNHVHPPPMCNSPVAESPHLHSSSTYHTAPSCSSPTISSATSTPLRQNDYILPSKPPIVINQSAAINMAGYYAQDIPLAPVITNKYALQEDTALDGQMQIRGNDNAVYSSAIFTILNPRKCDKYQQGDHQTYRTNERWDFSCGQKSYFLLYVFIYFKKREILFKISYLKPSEIFECIFTRILHRQPFNNLRINRRSSCNITVSVRQCIHMY